MWRCGRSRAGRSCSVRACPDRPSCRNSAENSGETISPDRKVLMLKIVRRLRKNETGAALVEYALIIAGVALIGAAAVSIFGNKVTDMLATAAAILPGAHADSNAPIVSGKIIETSPNAPGFDEGNSATGI